MNNVIVFLAVCTYYGSAHEGNIQANGEPFDPEGWTCATYTYPIGTYLEVHYEGREVLVEVTDRPDDKTDIDLSRRAFEKIAHTDLGRIEVIVKFDVSQQSEAWVKKYGGEEVYEFTDSASLLTIF